jgi:hypothetical protein
MIEHFVRVANDGKPLGVFRVTPREIARIDVKASRWLVGSRFKAQVDDADAWQAMRRQAPSWLPPGNEGVFHRVELGPGRFYRRIDRPVLNPWEGEHLYLGGMPGRDLDQDAIAKGLGQLAVLLRALERICQAVHPQGRNLAAYGHETRNLLILAAMEVEAHCRGVLKLNGYGDGRLTTNDYVKLAPVMKLRQYAVTFPQYPWLEPFAPFKDWDCDRATGSLAWYDAYNATKHDRERAFARGSLKQAFDAVSACAIMMAAQFGEAGQLQAGDGGAPAVWQLFVFEPGEHYVPPFKSPGRWRAQAYRFV